MAVPTYTKSGTKASTSVKLDNYIFGAEVKNHELLKQAYLLHLANSRTNLAVTKKRGDVRGGGKKPWRQKGTGRARFGSSRNPIWRGGGIAFGPTGSETYTKRLPLTAKRRAIRQALSLAVQANKLLVIESFDTKERKVKPVIALMDKIGAKGKILLIGSEKNDFVECSTRNLASVTAKQASYINVFEILNADTIIISKEALDIVGQWLGEKS
jgi:large subunit ribosomal protein L4